MILFLQTFRVHILVPVVNDCHFRVLLVPIPPVFLLTWPVCNHLSIHGHNMQQPLDYRTVHFHLRSCNRQPIQSALIRHMDLHRCQNLSLPLRSNHHHLPIHLIIIHHHIFHPTNTMNRRIISIGENEICINNSNSKTMMI